MKNIVTLKYIDDYKIDRIEQAVKESFSLLKLNSIVKNKMKVLLKVCMPYSGTPDSAAACHPFVVRAIVNQLCELGAECIIADSPYKKYSYTHLESVYLNTGMLSVANNTRCKLNDNLKTFTLDTPNGIKAKNMILLDVINDVDIIINIGKVKIDDRLGYLGACSNIFGFIPGEYKTLILNRLDIVADYNNYLIDMIDALKGKLVFNVLDAIVGIEGNDMQRMLSLIAMSENVFSLDATILDIIGLDYKNTIISLAKKRGFLDEKTPYTTIGEELNLFKLEDFALNDVTLTSKIHKSRHQKNRYFNLNQNKVVIDKDKCKGCTICSKICPANAIMMKYDKNGELYAHIDYDKCIFCSRCKSACPYSVVETRRPVGYARLEAQVNKHNVEEN